MERPDCRDLAFFYRQLLGRRELDDKLRQRLNLIGSVGQSSRDERRACRDLREELETNFCWRTRSIRECIAFYETDMAGRAAGLSSSEAMIRIPFEKHKGLVLLREYLQVEDVLQAQAWVLFNARCRDLGDNKNV